MSNFFAGLFGGIIVGAVLIVGGVSQVEKVSINRGFVVLDGRVFKIVEAKP